MNAAERRKTPHLYYGVDLRAEARLYCRHLGIKLPEMRFRHDNRKGISGRAWHVDNRIVLTLGQSTPERAREILLHELVHLAEPGQDHNERFCSRLVRAARQLFGVPVNGWTSVKAKYGKRAYAIDELIIEEMQTRRACAESATAAPQTIEAPA